MGEIAKLSAEQLADLRRQLREANPDKNKYKDTVLETEDTAAAETKKQYVISVAPDKMSATLILSDPGEDEAYTFAEIMGELRKRLIVTGINGDEIMRMINSHIYDEPVIIAMGKPVVPAVEGYYEFLFDTAEHTKPAIREDGTTDYSSVGRLENVEQGQKIAVYHPACQGRNGYNVNGQELVAKIARELPPLRGIKIEHNEDTGEYFAKQAGKISLKDNNIEILDVHEINDNVTLVQGKVEFFGDLYINGDVESGVVIRSARNVIISGTVGAATIFAGGDVILSKGIQGAGKGRVSARGNVFSDFVEYAKIDAGMDVYANSIINSAISTGGSVVVSGKRGSIIGGETHGLRGITANAAGNVTEVKTVLHSGFPESDYIRFAQLAKKERDSDKELTKIMEGITKLLKLRAKNGAFTGEQKELIIQLKNKKDAICSEMDRIKEEKSQLGRSMAMATNSCIVIRGDVYRNVLVCIDVAKLLIEEKESYVKYVCRNDVIERRTVPV